ncbi:MAG: hypothetical protein ACSLFP_07235 [Acidimicrobiales bacterium]
MRSIASRELRYLLTLLLRETGRPMTIRELVAAVEASGVRIDGRAGKVISDSLRWEVRRGRAVRVGRASYRAGEMPRSTASWMRHFLPDRMASSAHSAP